MSVQVRTETEFEEQTIASAIAILEKRIKGCWTFNGKKAVQDFLRIQAQGLQHEVFAVMYLDTRHRMIGYEKLFHGTLSWTPVIPREVVRHVLMKNAAAVILHHNHPSGCCRPSASDIELTIQLRQALGLIDVQVMDHVITSDVSVFSMAADSDVWPSVNTRPKRTRVKRAFDSLLTI